MIEKLGTIKHLDQLDTTHLDNFLIAYERWEEIKDEATQEYALAEKQREIQISQEARLESLLNVLSQTPDFEDSKLYNPKSISPERRDLKQSFGQKQSPQKRSLTKGNPITGLVPYTTNLGHQGVVDIFDFDQPYNIGSLLQNNHLSNRRLNTTGLTGHERSLIQEALTHPKSESEIRFDKGAKKPSNTYIFMPQGATDMPSGFQERVGKDRYAPIITYVPGAIIPNTQPSPAGTKIMSDLARLPPVYAVAAYAFMKR